MKEILYHYVVMRKIEVPDECPTDDIYRATDWIERQGHAIEDCVTSEDTRDCEITDVRDVENSNNNPCLKIWQDHRKEGPCLNAE
ncbi:MAG: hypothetical protein GY774_16635 [Planctomycetes bacterium]|nr:hypothetical protein [Planctomycetota bacterium]